MSRFGSQCLVLCVTALVLNARPARAEGFISPLIGLSFGGDAVNCAGAASCGRPRRTGWGVSAGTSHGIFGFEEDINYVSEFFGPSQAGKSNAVLTITSNFMVRFPTGLVRPYGVFGLAFVRPHVTLDAAGFGADKTTLGYDVGGGVELYVHPKIGLRSDLRRVRTLQDMSFGTFGSEQLEFWRGSAGLTLRF